MEITSQSLPRCSTDCAIGAGSISPAFDLLFLANLGWPLLLLPGISLPIRASTSGKSII